MFIRNYKRAVIFANGEQEEADVIANLLESDDLIIAADGGGNHCQALGITPHVLIGDFDSLEADVISTFRAAGTEIIRHPQRKNFTDLELALILAQERGIREIVVLNALGRRWDQTLANMLLPGASIFVHTRIRLLSGFQEIQVLHAGETLQLTGKPGDTVSLIPLGGDAFGITTSGLEYPLFYENLLFGSTRGISNVLLNEYASVTLDQGLLLCVLIHRSFL